MTLEDALAAMRADAEAAEARREADNRAVARVPPQAMRSFFAPHRRKMGTCAACGAARLVGNLRKTTGGRGAVCRDNTDCERALTRWARFTAAKA